MNFLNSMYRVRDLSTWGHGQGIADAIQSGPYRFSRISAFFMHQFGRMKTLLASNVAAIKEMG
jgi:hypothetical protein